MLNWLPCMNAATLTHATLVTLQECCHNATLTHAEYKHQCCQVLWGRKRWFLTHRDEKPDYSPDETTCVSLPPPFLSPLPPSPPPALPPSLPSSLFAYLSFLLVFSSLALSRAFPPRLPLPLSPFPSPSRTRTRMLLLHLSISLSLMNEHPLSNSLRYSLPPSLSLSLSLARARTHTHTHTHTQPLVAAHALLQSGARGLQGQAV